LFRLRRVANIWLAGEMRPLGTARDHRRDTTHAVFKMNGNNVAVYWWIGLVNMINDALREIFQFVDIFLGIALVVEANKENAVGADRG